MGVCSILIHGGEHWAKEQGQAHLLMMRLVNIPCLVGPCLVVQIRPNLLWGLYNKNLQVTSYKSIHVLVFLVLLCPTIVEFGLFFNVDHSHIKF